MSQFNYITSRKELHMGRAFGARVLKMDRPAAGGFVSLTTFQAEGCGIALSGDEYEVSVTDLPFCVI